MAIERLERNVIVVGVEGEDGEEEEEEQLDRACDAVDDVVLHSLEDAPTSYTYMNYVIHIYEEYVYMWMT